MYGIINKMDLDSPANCFDACLNAPGCKSFSVSNAQNLCYLNNVTRSQVPHLGYVVTNETEVSTLPPATGFQYYELI